jgi:hypothetical protein
VDTLAPLLVLAVWSGLTTVTTRAAGALPLLLVVLGSLVAAVLKAVLVKNPLMGALTVTVKFAVAPLARLATAGQVTTPPR